MRRIVLTYGLISGFVIIGSIVVGLFVGLDDGHVAGLQWLGYLVMIVAFSAIFVGVKRYRDRELGGVIRFGTATGVGLGITLVASVVYVASWEVSLAATDYRFIDEYARSEIERLEGEGVSDEVIAEEEAKMEELKERYGHVPFRLAITFSEIFPVGLVMTLISAAVLRRSEVLAEPAESLTG